MQRIAKGAIRLDEALPIAKTDQPRPAPASPARIIRTNLRGPRFRHPSRPVRNRLLPRRRRHGRGIPLILRQLRQPEVENLTRLSDQRSNPRARRSRRPR